jgi:REP element-mobilizing transposase RayT
LTTAPLPDRRRPSHHAPVERFNEPLIVQVNVCTSDRRAVLACPEGHALCRDVWHAADSWRVGQYVIMPDHIHLFCAPGRVPAPSLKQWVEFWKSRIASRWPGKTDGTAGFGFGGTGSVPSAKGAQGMKTDDTEVVPPGFGLGGTGSVPSASDVQKVRTERAKPFKLWQRDFWDTQMRTREHYDEKLAYVRMNPVRKGLAKTPEDWQYQGEVFPIGWR